MSVFYSYYHQTQLKTIQHPSYIISRVVLFFGVSFSVLPNFREHIFLARTSISALFSKHHIYKIMKKSNYVVWPAPSSKFLRMARGPKSLATPGLSNCSCHKPQVDHHSLVFVCFHVALSSFETETKEHVVDAPILVVRLDGTAAEENRHVVAQVVHHGDRVRLLAASNL